MSKDSAPKKPLTPFFMFREKQKEKGNTLGGKEAGKMWKEMSDEEKKPYTEAYRKQKDKYDRYLEEVEGIPAKSSSKKKEKPTCYRSSRIRAVIGHGGVEKQMDTKAYAALGRVVVLAHCLPVRIGKLHVRSWQIRH